MEILLKGVFEKRRFLDLVKHFLVFGDAEGRLVKILAGYHQFHAVRHAVQRTLAATSPEGDRKVGVIWHTQGSGKSLLMAFYAGQIVKHPAMQNPTLVVLTDRTTSTSSCSAPSACAATCCARRPSRRATGMSCGGCWIGRQAA